MSIERRQITVAGMPVQVVRKPIKNLHLGVYPPNGRVRVAAPLAITDAAVRLAVVNKLGWIKRQQSYFRSQPRQTRREMVSGESHYFLGRRYRLRVEMENKAAGVKLPGLGRMQLMAGKDSSAESRERFLNRWYRKRFQELLPALVKKWEERLAVHAKRCSIRQMKTRWGSCNPAAGAILLNLELIKKPMCCIEYIVVHELAHLSERHHNARFTNILDRHFPRWRIARKLLNSEPLGHAEWDF
jgi:hypothetical protein